MDTDEARLKFLIEQESELRDEVRDRISQRDSYGIQAIVTWGAILALALSDFEYSRFLVFMLPITSLFFAYQILSSYRVHRSIVTFISNYLEPEIAKLVSKPGEDKKALVQIMWQCHFNELRKDHNETRRNFLVGFLTIAAPFISCLIFSILSIARNGGFNDEIYIAIGLTVFFYILSALLLYKDKETKRIESEDQRKMKERLENFDNQQ